MKLLEFFTGSKKICHVCHESFYAEPLACPKCGAKVKTHKAEKWGAAIGAFAGSIEWVWHAYASFTASTGSKIIDGIAKSAVDEAMRPMFEDFVEKVGLVEAIEWYSFLGALRFIGQTIICTVAGFIITLVTKKVVLAVRAKKAKSND